MHALRKANQARARAMNGEAQDAQVSSETRGALLPLAGAMARSGAWLFRRRTYLPVFLLAAIVAAAAGAPGEPPAGIAWRLACGLIAVAGMTVRIVAVGFAGERTSGRNTRRQVADSLNTDGAYSVVRHPLYLGNLLTWMGVALLPGIASVAVVVLLVFVAYYERIAMAEEEFLRDRFGAEFLAWAARTPAFVPAPSSARSNPATSPSAAATTPTASTRTCLTMKAGA